MMHPRFRAVPACFLLLATLAARDAAAEPRVRNGPTGEPARAAMDEAKALYVAGNRAVEQGRWADALTSFERSYELSGVAAALFNIATTLRALGRHVEARDAFAQLLSKHRQIEPDIKKKAETMLVEERGRVASLVLAGLPELRPELRLLIDGNAGSDDGSRPLLLDLDPGRHTVNVEEPRSRPFSWEGSLADGEKKTLNVKLTPQEPTSAPAPAPAPAPVEAPKRSSSVFRSPIFWGVVGVLVVGGAVAGGYYWHESRQLDPGSGTVIKL